MKERSTRFIVVLTTVLSACVNLPSKTAPTVRLFTLPLLVSERGPGSKAVGSLRIEEPLIASPYRGTLIAIRDAPQSTEIRYSREARFAASIGALLGERLADLATDRGEFVSVVRAGQSGPADWMMVASVEAFECRVAGASLESHVVMTVSLQRDRGSERVFAGRYEETSAVVGSDAAALIAALARAFDQLGRKVIDDIAAASSSVSPAAKSL